LNIKGKTMLNRRTTDRGFDIITFNDKYGHECSLQESSANEPAIWFGPNEAEPKILVKGGGWQPVDFPEETMFNTRMHLTQDQVKELLPYLQHFAEHGCLNSCTPQQHEDQT
jgi:hypothetical protein